MEQANKCQGIVNSAWSQYVREKYNSSETSNRRIAKFVTSLQKKHGIFSVLDSKLARNQNAKVTVTDDRFQVNLFPINILIKEVFWQDVAVESKHE